MLMVVKEVKVIKVGKLMMVEKVTKNMKMLKMMQMEKVGTFTCWSGLLGVESSMTSEQGSCSEKSSFRFSSMTSVEHKTENSSACGHIQRSPERCPAVALHAEPPTGQSWLVGAGVTQPVSPLSSVNFPSGLCYKPRVKPQLGAEFSNFIHIYKLHQTLSLKHG